MTGGIFLLVLLLVLVAATAIPQRRARARRAAVQRALDRGSSVLTIGGLYGRVADIRDHDLDLELAPGTVVRADRRAIAAIIEAGPAGPAPDAHADDTAGGATIQRSDDT